MGNLLKYGEAMVDMKLLGVEGVVEGANDVVMAWMDERGMEQRKSTILGNERGGCCMCR